MKKSIIIGSALLLCLSFTSCGGKNALDINVDELETACDFVDALDAVASEMLEITSDGEVAEDEKEQFEKLNVKVEEVSEAAEEKHPVAEAKKCGQWDALQEKVDQLEDYM